MSDVARGIVSAATELFADQGFDTALGDIANKAAVSENELRQHFPTHAALLEEVVAELFRSRWRDEWTVLLADRQRPLDQRLTQFFTEYRTLTDRTSTRLWTRAGLAGMHGSGRYNFSATLTQRILTPIVRELRCEQHLPTPDERQVTPAELDVAQMLHACASFPITRAYVFDMPFEGALGDMVAMMVRVWLPGAKAEIARINGGSR